MEIQTTININKISLDQLNHASSILRISKTQIIRLLLKQILEDNRNVKIFLSPVKFQPRDDKSNWYTFHLTLREDEYEFCLDLRKIYKMSVSYIIALAIKKHLVKIINLLNGKSDKDITDNYLFHNYLFSFNITNGIKNFRIYWGITNFEQITS
jgi:hypothetical protein